MARKIRCNDEIIVISGRDRGKRGHVRCILPSGKAIVSGINIVKKHRKPDPSVNQLGGIFEQEAPIDISNLAIFNQSSNKSDRVGFIIKDNRKIRVFKSTGKIIK